MSKIVEIRLEEDKLILSTFLSLYCKKDPDAYISKAKFYEKYRKFCLDNNAMPLSRYWIGRHLPEFFRVYPVIKRINGKHHRVWRGIACNYR